MMPDNGIICKGCGTMLPERYSVVKYSCCPSCNTINARNQHFLFPSGFHNKVIGPCLTVLKVGTMGEFKGTKFEIIGQVHYSLRGGSINFYFLVCSNNDYTWIIEEDGELYWVNPFAEDKFYFSNIKKIKPLEEFDLSGKKYIVQYTDKSEEVYIDGEVKEFFFNSTIFVELFNEKNLKEKIFCTINPAQEGKQYHAALITLEDLKLFNSTKIPGQDFKEYINSISTNIDCNFCKKQFVVINASYINTYTCTHCNAIHYTDGSSAVQQKQANHFVPIIQPGTYGSLLGTEYLVMGVVQKKDNKYSVFWREYVLFNPLKGFAGLAEYKGHWNFIERKDEYLKVAENKYSFGFKGAVYKLFNRINARTVYFIGQFNWNTNFDIETNGSEFINPPYLLSVERTANSVETYLGTYIDQEDIVKGFALATPVKKPIGIGANQPIAISQRLNSVIAISAVAIVLLVFFHLVFIAISSQKKVLEKEYSLTENIKITKTDTSYRVDIDTNKLAGKLLFKANPYTVKLIDTSMTMDVKKIVTESFTIGDGIDNLQFEFYAPLNNSWLELNTVLTNEKTGEEFDFNLALEHYEGYTDGENWSEGRNSDRMILSWVPEGKYHLTIYPYKEERKVPSFSLTLTRNVPLESNLIWLILLIAIYPTIVYFRKMSLERKRWQDSDYSPFE